jgi:hypothetical protein
LLATWVTFIPCFLWIFLGAPFIERMRGNKALSGALSAITAAVVGVVLNLADLVRHPHDLPRDIATARRPRAVRHAGADQRGSLGARNLDCRDHCDVPVEDRHLHDPWRSLGCWDRALSRRCPRMIDTL